MEILSLHSVIPEFCHITGIKTQAWFHDYIPDDLKEVQQNVGPKSDGALSVCRSRDKLTGLPSAK